MRTTLNIEDELYRKIKSKAALEGKKVTDLIHEGLLFVLNEKSPKGNAIGIKKNALLPLLDRSNGKMLFKNMTTEETIDHLKKLDLYAK